MCELFIGSDGGWLDGFLKIFTLLRACRPIGYQSMTIPEGLMVWIEGEAFRLVPGLSSLFSLGLHGPGKTCREAHPFGKAGGRGRRGQRAECRARPAGKPGSCTAISVPARVP